MDLTLRRADDRGGGDRGWLRTRHTFSFADYHDPAHMGFRELRVINEDRVAPSRGFGRHPHRDMEIVTYVIDGAVEHRDSLGNREILQANEVQRMTAGRGVEHSEMNPSSDEPLHLLQIWIHPASRGLAPSYEQRVFAPDDKLNRLLPMVAPDDEGSALHINQDARILGTLLESGRELAYDLDADRHAWLQVVSGELDVDGVRLTAGDGASASGPGRLAFGAAETAEFLTFDLA